jgi:hypothetical protein
MSGLTKYDDAKRALAAAYRVDEVKSVRDKAMAMRLYAAQAKDRVLIDQATEIKLRAERRAGELLREAERAKPRGSNQHKDRSRAATDPPTLAELGVSKSQSSQWQKLAAIDEADFEVVVDRARSGASAALDRAQQPKPKPKPKPAEEDVARPNEGNGTLLDQALMPTAAPEPKAKPATDVVATCVAEVKSIVGAAMAELGQQEERLGLINQVEGAILRMKASLTKTDNPSRWKERS